MQTKTIERNFFFGLLSMAFIFTFFIFRPFLIVLILATSLSIVLYPIFRFFKKTKFPNWLASLLTVILFIIVLCMPLLTIGSLVLNQSQNIYHEIVVNGNSEVFINLIGSKINQLLPDSISFNLSEKISGMVSFLTNNLTGIFSATFSFLFSFILLILAIFYILKDGEEWKKALIEFSPLSETNNKKILTRLTQTINGVMKGVLFVSLVQGVLMGIGLSIFGVPNAALWGVAAGIASQIPVFGTAFISIPAMIFLFTTGNTTAAIGLLIWSLVTVGIIDNFLVPYFIGNKVNIPSFLILFSILGGISLLGPVGILIGPLVISFLYGLVAIYRNDFQSNENS